ncbi:MAG: GNAT family N-acetyltransferase [Anaerolineae bacterium]|nr:GNAT family N-acetyltransferase [Anaerolineae bacterium]
MNSIPTLDTERLLLRAFTPEDAPAIQAILNDPAITDNMNYIPYPCTLEWVQAYIQRANEDLASGRYTFGIVRRADGVLVGRINIRVAAEHHSAEIGYWIGRAFWGNGYATEAARRVLDFGFNDLGLNRIMGQCFARNAASAHVLEKIGMRYEGTLREDFLKNGVYESTHVYAVLRSDYAGVS